MDPGRRSTGERALRQWEALRAHLPRPRPPGRPDRPGPRPARHGLRRQRRHRRRRHRATAPGSATRARPPRPPRYRDWFARRRLRACVEPESSTRARATSCVGRRPADPRRHRLPHRPARARRGRRSARPPGGPAASWSTRASTTSTPRWPCSTTTTIAYCPEAFSPGVARGAAPAASRTRSSPTPADAAVLGLNAVSDGRHVVLARAGHRPGRRSSPSAASTRSRSTCPSCSRAAAEPSAARWRCAR